MSARDLIDLLQDDHYPQPPSSWSRVFCSCGWKSERDKGLVSQQFDDHCAAAIAAAGYAVVKLPAPSGHDCYLRDVWDVSADYHVIRYPDGAVGLAENGGCVTEYSPDAAIDLAAALLAAARHADGEDQ